MGSKKICFKDLEYILKILSKAGEHELCIEEIDHYTNSGIKNINMVSLKCTFLRELGRKEEALKVYDEEIFLMQNEIDKEKLKVNKIFMLLDCKKIVEAFELMNELKVYLDDNYFLKSFIYYELKDFKKCLFFIEKEIKIYGSGIHITLLKIKVLIQLNQLKTALIILKNYIIKNPENEYCLKMLEKFKMSNGDYNSIFFQEDDFKNDFVFQLHND